MPRRDSDRRLREIEPGDVGIWASCSRSKEAPSVSDLRDLFRQVGAQPQLLGIFQIQ